MHATNDQAAKQGALSGYFLVTRPGKDVVTEQAQIHYRQLTVNRPRLMRRLLFEGVLAWHDRQCMRCYAWLARSDRLTLWMMLRWRRVSGFVLLHMEK